MADLLGLGTLRLCRYDLLCNGRWSVLALPEGRRKLVGEDL